LKIREYFFCSSSGIDEKGRTGEVLAESACGLLGSGGCDAFWFGDRGGRDGGVEEGPVGAGEGLFGSRFGRGGGPFDMNSEPVEVTATVAALFLMGRAGGPLVVVVGD